MQLSQILDCRLNSAQCHLLFPGTTSSSKFGQVLFLLVSCFITIEFCSPAPSIKCLKASYWGGQKRRIALTQEFETSLDNIVKPCFKKQTQSRVW